MWSAIPIRHHKTPALGRQLLSNRILLNVANRSTDIVNRIEKDSPLATGKRLRMAAIRHPMRTKRMDILAVQLAGCRAFQLIRDLLDRETVSINDKMDMIGQNGASPYHERRSIGVFREAASRCACLNPGKADGRVFQRLLGTMAKIRVMGPSGKRLPC